MIHFPLSVANRKLVQTGLYRSKKEELGGGCGGGKKVNKERAEQAFPPGVLVSHVEIKNLSSEVRIREVHAFLRWLIMDVSGDNFSIMGACKHTSHNTWLSIRQ